MNETYQLEQWKKIHWETDTRYYSVILQQDLFHSWNITRQWGGRHNERFGQKSNAFFSIEEAQKELEVIYKTREQRGYSLCLN